MSAVALPVPVRRTLRARALASIAAWLGLGLALPVVALVVSPVAFGFRSVTILSGSMTPTLRVGDVVMERRVAPMDLEIGDIVTFPSPDHPGRTFTHRIVSMRLDKGRVSFVTEGDANSGTESWSVPANGKLGRASFRIPKLGYITNRAGSRVGRLVLIVGPALLLGLYEMRRIWTRDRDDDDAPAA